MSASNGTCAVLVPVARDIEPATQEALSQLQDRGYVVRILMGGSQVDLVRSAMASQAMQEGFEETLWVDSDVSFRPDDVEKLRAHNLPIVAGLYVKKKRDEFACKFAEGTKALTFGVGGGLLEMKYVGMGFTLIKAEVYSAIKSGCMMPECGGGYDPTKFVTPYFIPMVAEENGGHCYLSEDYSFCHRAAAQGFKPMADTSIKLGHSGRTWNDLLPRQSYETLNIGVQ